MMSSASCFLTMARQIGPQISGLFMTRSQKPDTLFTPFELVMVMSHYNIGAISAVEPFKRGSAASPKIILTTASREYLLKRRAPGKDDLELLQISHGIQLHLANQQFPLPHLILTAADNRSWVQMDKSVYELFEFLPGEAFNYEKPATYNTGRTLGLFHKLTRDYPMIPEYSERGCYHANRTIDVAFNKIKAIIQADSQLATGEKAAAAAQQAMLQEAYHKAEAKVAAAGLADWPLGIVHADFHPGNCLYKGEHVVGVIDFDSCRAQQPILDTANAALQYSIRLGSGDPRNWKENLHAGRLKAFVSGYESILQLSEAELHIMPSLMVESMICEVALGLASRGQLRGFGPAAWLEMLSGKVAWICEHEKPIIKTLDEA